MRVLLVEDNAGDVRLIREAFREAGAPIEIQVAEDGEKALRILARQNPYEGAAVPHLILLDLNLPRISGREVLNRIKSDPDLRRIPVVVLSSSPRGEDVMSSYNEHANCYIRKPIAFDEFMAMIRGLVDFWMNIVSLPALPPMRSPAP